MREICNALEILMKIYSKECNIKKIDCPPKSLKAHQASEHSPYCLQQSSPTLHPSGQLYSIHTALFISSPTCRPSDLDTKYI